MRILIATTQVPFVFGGAEVHARSLCQALQTAGHEAEIVAIPFKWYPPEKILDHLLACRLLDLTDTNGVPVDRVIGLKFPAYHIPHPNKVLWVLHQYRTAFDLWPTSDCDLVHYPDGRQMQTSITAMEKKLLPEARRIYANSQTVAQRLQKFSQIEAQPLYHPPQKAEAFYCAESQPYFFYPSRICTLKRQELVIRAAACCKEPVEIRFAGKPDNARELEHLQTLCTRLGIAQRIHWLGMISEEEKLRQYANCRAVVFPPRDEDYGYITLEAMLASKPVITCTDSGGPLEFIESEHNGLITEPEPEQLAQAMDRLWKEDRFAQEAGTRGHARYHDLHINWPHVVATLLA